MGRGRRASTSGGGKDRVALSCVVVKEELEPGELDGLVDFTRFVRVELEPRLTPAIHVDHDLHPRIEFYLRRVLEHVHREPMDDQHFGRQVVLRDERCELVDRVVDVRRIHCPDLLAGNAALAVVVHVELGIHSQVHVGPLKKRKQQRQLRIDRALARLDVENRERAACVREVVDLLDQIRIRPLAVHSVLSRLTLGDGHDEVQRRLHRCRRIGRMPLGDDRIELGEHLIVRDLAENAHALRERIPVERDDPFVRQNRAGQWAGAVRTGHPVLLSPARIDATSEKLSARVRLFGCVATTIATAESAASLRRPAESRAGGNASRAATSATALAGPLGTPPALPDESPVARVSAATPLDFGVSLQATVRRANDVANQRTRIDSEKSNGHAQVGTGQAGRAKETSDGCDRFVT